MLKKTIFGLTEADEIKSSKILDLAQKGSNVLSTDLSWATQISELVQKAVGQTGLMNGTYNIVTMITALMLVPLAMKFSTKKFTLPLYSELRLLYSCSFHKKMNFLFFPDDTFRNWLGCNYGIALFYGFARYSFRKTWRLYGNYQYDDCNSDAFANHFFGFIYKNLLGSNPVNAIILAGILFVLAKYFSYFYESEKNQWS